MARIPTFADVGFNDPRATTPTPTYPQSDPVATAEGEFGQGLQQAGGAAIKVGNDLEDRRQALNVANATVDMTSRLIDLHTQAQIENDPTKLADIRQQFSTILPTSANAIDDPQRKALFVAQHSPSVLQAQFDVDKRLALLGKASHAANTERDLDTLAGKAAATGDPNAAEAALIAGKQQIDATAAAIGNPEWGYTRGKRFASELFTGAADKLIEQGKPDQARALLDAHAGDIDPIHADVLRRRIQAKGVGIAGDAVAASALGLVPGGALAGDSSTQGGDIPPLRPVPPEYAPIVEKAAMQYGVPAQLLARTIHAESSFNPGAVSPTGARGIAQFITSTAGHYGVDRADSTSSIMGAAHYLSDLHEKTGSWQGALQGYLGSDPWQDKSYKGSGAIQLASVLDSGKGAPPTSEPDQAPVPASGSVVAFGDSIAAHLIRKAGAGGQESGTVGAYNPGDTAVSGWSPTQVLQAIAKAPDDSIRGKNVALSTGASNNPTQLDFVPEQIKAFRDRGAASVTVMGVGTKPSLAGVNDKLAQIAKDNGATFSGPLQQVASDGIHSSNPQAELAEVQQAIPAGAQAAPAAAPDQMVGQPAQNQPQPGQTPPVHPAPGMAELAAAEAELAQKRARAITAVMSDPRSADPAVMAHAITKIEAPLREQQLAITAQKQAITEARSAAQDSYVQQMIKGPVDPSILHNIGTDQRLDAASRENLWRVYETHVQHTTDGDAAKYGPKFFDYYQRITAPDNDPNKIRDPSQILSLAVPKSDGSQDLTLAGVDKLRQELSASRSPERVGDQKRIEGALAYAKHQLSFEQDYGYFKIPDPKGADAFNVGFIPSFFSYYEKGLAAGKRPDELLSQDAIDKLISPLKRSPEDLARDQLNSGTEAGTASVAAKPASPGAPPEAAINYLHAHPELRGAFEQKYKVPAAQFLTPLDTGPQAPMAR